MLYLWSDPPPPKRCIHEIVLHPTCLKSKPNHVSACSSYEGLRRPIDGLDNQKANEWITSGNKTNNNYGNAIERIHPNEGGRLTPNRHGNNFQWNVIQPEHVVRTNCDPSLGATQGNGKRRQPTPMKFLRCVRTSNFLVKANGKRR